MTWNVPHSWDWVPLSSLVKQRKENVLPSNHPDTFFNYLSLDNIEKETGEILSKNKTLGVQIGSGKNGFLQGDVLYGKLRPYLMKFAIAPFDGIAVTDIVPLICKPEVDSRYLLYFFKTNHHVQAIVPLMSGINLPRLRIGDLLQQEIPLPPLNEQRRIAAKIEELQSRSKKAREALAEAENLLEQLRQSVLHAAFTGKLTAAWREANPNAEPASKLLERIRAERRKRWEESELAKYEAKGKTPPKGWQKKYPEPAQVDTSELPELPEGWCWASLDEVTHSVQYGTSEKTRANGDVPVFRMGNIVGGKLLFDNLKYLPTASVSPELILNDGDILFNRTNSIELVGKCAVFRGQDKATFASYLIRVAPIIIPSDLLSEYINSPFGRAWVLSVASQQVGQANVNGTKLKSLAIPIAPFAEQKMIADFFVQTRKAIESIHEIIATGRRRINLLDQSILAKAFRGELVPQDPNDEPASELLKRIKAEAATAVMKKRKRGD